MTSKKPIEEISELLKELKKDIIILKQDVSYIKKRIYAQDVKDKLEEQKSQSDISIEKGWFW